MTTDPELLWCQLLVKLRRKGGSLRSIAKVTGYSKSTLHRLWPAIEERAGLSQTGQSEQSTGGEQRSLEGGVSHLGQTPLNADGVERP